MGAQATKESNSSRGAGDSRTMEGGEEEEKPLEEEEEEEEDPTPSDDEEMPQLSEEQKKLIKETWKEIESDVSRVGVVMFVR